MLPALEAHLQGTLFGKEGILGPFHLGKGGMVTSRQSASGMRGGGRLGLSGAQQGDLQAGQGGEEWCQGSAAGGLSESRAVQHLLRLNLASHHKGQGTLYPHGPLGAGARQDGGVAARVRWDLCDEILHSLHQLSPYTVGQDFHHSPCPFSRHLNSAQSLPLLGTAQHQLLNLGARAGGA
jgi:hypothetical protein